MEVAVGRDVEKTVGGIVDGGDGGRLVMGGGERVGRCRHVIDLRLRQSERADPVAVFVTDAVSVTEHASSGIARATASVTHLAGSGAVCYGGAEIRPSATGDTVREVVSLMEVVGGGVGISERSSRAATFVVDAVAVTSAVVVAAAEATRVEGSRRTHSSTSQRGIDWIVDG